MGRRIIKASEDALAGLEVRQDAARLNGSNESFFYTDESGCYIGGNISIRANPENIRIATGYTFPTAYEAQLPSTVVNPQPMLIANSPVEGFANFAAEVSRLLGQLL
jgi:hypothetical protein